MTQIRWQCMCKLQSMCEIVKHIQCTVLGGAENAPRRKIMEPILPIIYIGQLFLVVRQSAVRTSKKEHIHKHLRCHRTLWIGCNAAKSSLLVYLTTWLVCNPPPPHTLRSLNFLCWTRERHDFPPCSLRLPRDRRRLSWPYIRTAPTSTCRLQTFFKWTQTDSCGECIYRQGFSTWL